MTTSTDQTATVTTFDGEQHVGVIPASAAVENPRIIDLIPQPDPEGHLAGSDPEVDDPEDVRVLAWVASEAVTAVGAAQPFTLRELAIGLAIRKATLDVVALGVTGS